MQSTLTDLCIHTIADQIYRSPPMIQELIIEKSSDIIERKVKTEVKQELFNELKVLKTIVASISKSIIIRRSSFFNDDIDYYKIYNDTPRDIVKLAIEIAENTVDKLNNSFGVLTFVSSRRYNFYSNETTSDDLETESSSESQ